MLCSFIGESRGTWLLLCVFGALGQLKYNVEISGTYNFYQLSFIKFCNVFHLRKKVVFHFRLFYQLLFEFQELLLLHCQELNFVFFVDLTSEIVVFIVIFI